MSKEHVDPLLEELAELKLKYDLLEDDLVPLGALAQSCLAMLGNVATLVPQGALTLRGEPKTYIAYQAGDKRSRPIRNDLFLPDAKQFAIAWQGLLAAVDRPNRRLVFPQADAAIYTATQAFSCAVDLLKPGSRKIPGTHFEILIGTLLGSVTGLKRGKQVKVPGEGYTVPTDIVLLRSEEDPGPVLVVPTKITSRERIVQPFAHQRILDEVYGRGKYRSIMVFSSETQRADGGSRGLNEICVPNQVGMFQEYLAKMYGLYYLDVPHAYATAKFASTLPVRPIGELLANDLPKLLTP